MPEIGARMEAVFLRGLGMRLQLGAVYLADSVLPFHALKRMNGGVIPGNGNDPFVYPIEGALMFSVGVGVCVADAAVAVAAAAGIGVAAVPGRCYCCY